MSQVPQQEARGGDKVDWARATAGEPLPELPPEEYPEPDSLTVTTVQWPFGDAGDSGRES
jgi:hypothetical protein